jgi:hypothetical protein
MSIFAGLPAAANAADSTALPVTVFTIGAAPYDLELDLTTEKSGTGWKWTPSSSEPTLQLDETYSSGSVRIISNAGTYPATINLALAGDVALTKSIWSFSRLAVFPVTAAGAVSSTTKKLTVNGGDILVYRSGAETDLDLYKVALTVNSNTATDKTSTSIDVRGNLTIRNGSSVAASGAGTGLLVSKAFGLTDSSLTTSGSENGLITYGNLVVTASTLTATGTKYGAYVEGGATSFSGTSTVNLTGNQQGIFTNKTGSKDANISVDASTLTATGLGISGGAFTIGNASTVKLTGKKGSSSAIVKPSSPANAIEIKDIKSKVTLVNDTGLTDGVYYPVFFKHPAALSAVWKVTPGSSLVDPGSTKENTIVVKQIKETAVIQLQSVSNAEYYLAVIVDPTSSGGTVTGGNGYYHAGDKVTIKATPSTADGYLFGGWSSSEGGTFANASSQTTTFTMPAGGVTVMGSFQMKGKIKINSNTSLSVKAVANQAKTGKQIKPAVSVSMSGKVLTKGTDYKVTYGTNKNVGIGTATIKGIGIYSGNKTISFRIVPKKTSVSKITTAKKKMTIKWGKVSGVTKYELQYRIKGNKTWKKATISKSAISVTVKNLKKGKTYQVRIRSLQTVNKESYPSAWSKIKVSKKIK